MPRRNRIIIPGEVYHVVNRGNDKQAIFRSDGDFERFLTLLVQGRNRVEIEIFGFSLMSTHFHLLLRPGKREALSRYMHWVEGTYAVDFRTRTETLGFGHLFKERYFAAPVEDELGYLTVLGYIEMNARAAKIVDRAEDWRWCSLYDRARPRRGLANYELLSLPTNWPDLMNLDWNTFLLALVDYDLAQRCRRRSS
jgi:putative transposase